MRPFRPSCIMCVSECDGNGGLTNCQHFLCVRCLQKYPPGQCPRCQKPCKLIRLSNAAFPKELMDRIQTDPLKMLQQTVQAMEFQRRQDGLTIQRFRELVTLFNNNHKSALQRCEGLTKELEICRGENERLNAEIHAQKRHNAAQAAAAAAAGSNYSNTPQRPPPLSGGSLSTPLHHGGMTLSRRDSGVGVGASLPGAVSERDADAGARTTGDLLSFFNSPSLGKMQNGRQPPPHMQGEQWDGTPKVNWPQMQIAGTPRPPSSAGKRPRGLDGTEMNNGSIHRLEDDPQQRQRFLLATPALTLRGPPPSGANATTGAAAACTPPSCTSVRLQSLLPPGPGGAAARLVRSSSGQGIPFSK